MISPVLQKSVGETALVPIKAPHRWVSNLAHLSLHLPFLEGANLEGWGLASFQPILLTLGDLGLARLL